MQTRPHVLAFCRYPQPGAVKTRLARHIGPTRASALYTAFVRDVLDALDASGASVTICATPERPAADYTLWLGPERRLQQQQGVDLGQRMANAFSQTFAEGRPQALLVGTDVPQLPPMVIRQAWQALERADLVLGPATDGGYYLIGMKRRRFLENVFQTTSWSTRHVLQQTLARLPRGARHAMLPPLRDCDDLEDLRHLLAHAPSGVARATRRQALALNLL